jgi:hypothetical protein
MSTVADLVEAAAPKILGHDLRNPASAVLSLSSTLAQRADVPERTREDCATFTVRLPR